MKKDKNKIKIKKILSKKDPFKDINHKNCITPHKGWRTLVWVAIFAGLILIAFSLYLFYKIKADELFKVEKIEETQLEVVNQNLLENILKSFQEKEINSEKILNGEFTFKDPS